MDEQTTLDSEDQQGGPEDIEEGPEQEHPPPSGSRAISVGPRTQWFQKALTARQGDGTESRGLGTFAGVFRPTILTILGVMMYLRMGWVVGEAGLGGAVLILLLTFLITSSTALALSSITTNIRLGAGGAFSVISQSLGLETGGSIGIPLFLAQALSAALYIYGFTEAWLFIFPEHPQWAVAGTMFLTVFAITMISTNLASRLQGIVMVVILASLGSIVLGLTQVGVEPVEQVFHNPQLWGNFTGASFWEIFAVFFPAGTGIMVGASMSGALRNPRRSIPRGTMFAVGTAFFVYLFFAVWYGVVAPPEELRTNFLVVVQEAAWGPLVLAGILASTFTAALSSFVASPRVLQSLSKYRIIPGAEKLAEVSASGEPRRAIVATGVLVGASLFLGSLDRVAVLITMFFLITYVTINAVVLIEQSLGMVSFRPKFKIPILVPALGFVFGIIAIFVISPTFALFAMALVVAIYGYLVNQKLETPWETVRSSIFVSLADWASRRVSAQPEEANERSWKPDLLVPVASRSQLDGNFRFLAALTSPKGSLQIVGVRPPRGAGLPTPPELPSPTAGDIADEPAKQKPSYTKQSTVPGVGPLRLPSPSSRRDVAELSSLGEIAHEFRQMGLYASTAVLEVDSLVKGVEQAASVLRGSYFRPNVLFALAHAVTEEALQGLLDVSVEFKMGAAFLYRHPESGLGHEQVINVWVRDQAPDWHLGLRLANLDLSILFGYQVGKNWNGTIRLLTVCRNDEDTPMAEQYLEQLIEDARLPAGTKTWVESGAFLERLEEAPHADLHIVGLPAEIDRDFLREMVARAGTSVLFVRDSGRESALA